MNTQTRDSLAEFYFGGLHESQRLEIEKQLLLDQELLLDYLDLKREIEGAVTVPQHASPFLWRRLQPLTRVKKWQWAGMAALVAAGVIGFYVLTNSHDPSVSPVRSGILFDSGAELSQSSAVL